MHKHTHTHTPARRHKWIRHTPTRTQSISNSTARNDVRYLVGRISRLLLVSVHHCEARRAKKNEFLFSSLKTNPLTLPSQQHMFAVTLPSQHMFTATNEENRDRQNMTPTRRRPTRIHTNRNLHDQSREISSRLKTDTHTHTHTHTHTQHTHTRTQHNTTTQHNYTTQHNTTQSNITSHHITNSTFEEFAAFAL